MASTFKYLSDHDRVVVNNELVTQVNNSKGTAWTSSSYDYFLPVASGSSVWATATRVFDVTFGRSSVTTGVSTQLSTEYSIYNQFAKLLLGHNSDNSIQKFNLEPSDQTGAKILHNAFFINFSRSQFKDRIKVGSFDLIINASGSEELHLIDSGSNGPVLRECQTGQYGLLFASSSNTTDFIEEINDNKVQGLLFYEAGVAVVSPYVFSKYDVTENPSDSNDYIDTNPLGVLTDDAPAISGSYNIKDLITGSLINDNAYALATHILTASYQSTTELNSTVYFCRAYNHEFNYSSNPTYLQNSKIVVKGDDPQIPPRTYITTVGLYSDDNQLLAVAKLSEPVLKTTDNELIAKVRLDF